MSDDGETCATGLVEDRYTDWYGFDTENDPTGKVTLTALVHESGNRSVFQGDGHFAELVEGEKLGKRPVVICHNLEYDLINEFGFERYTHMSLNYLKGRLISAKFHNTRFLDSFNHFRMRLADIGEAIGVAKLAMNIEDPDYVSQDAWICLNVMTRARDYIASLGGRIGATSGSSALSVWEYMTEGEYMTGPIDTPWLRRGYYGGRTEIFRPYTECPAIRHPETGEVKCVDKQGITNYVPDIESARLMEGKGELDICREQNIRGYDINSMYPFCMLNEFPEYLMDDPHFNKAKGMAEVTINLPASIFTAPLPFRTPKDELWYPVGIFRGVWTYDEIRTAESMGAKIVKVHRAMGCNVMVRPFNQFVETLYQKRLQCKDESERLFLKVLMNALYGKIASRNQVTRTVSRYNLMKNNSKRLDEVKWITYHRGLLDYFTPQQPYVNVCWGAMITAYARLLLLKYMRQVPPEKLIYCDTDSVYCVDFEMANSKALGRMKLEKTASIMKCVQPKAYRIDGFYRAKGVPRPKTDDHGNIVVDYARQYVEEGFTEFQAPLRFRQSINSRQGKANQWITKSKSRKTNYQAKRLSGDRYVPPVIGEQLELTLPKAGKRKTTSKHTNQMELIKA